MNIHTINLQEINAIIKTLHKYKIMKQKYYVCTQLFKLSTF